jgi:hypothetical protein
MKIIRTLQITSDEFYDYLEHNLLSLANKNRSGKPAYTSADIISGFHFSYGAEEAPYKTEFTVVEYRRNHHYKATSVSITEKLEISYHTKAVDKGLEVIYEQGAPQQSTKKKSNKLARGFSEALFLSRMSNSLYDIQTEIQRNRKNSHASK